MQEVMWDMISAGEFLNGYLLNKDSVDKLAESSKIYGQVLQIHKIKKEDFDKSFRYYREHPALMKALLDSLGKKTYAPAKLPGQADTVHKGGGSIISQKDTMRKRIRKALKAD